MKDEYFTKSIFLDKEELTFTQKAEKRLKEILDEAVLLERKVKIYQSLIMNLLSTLRSCEDSNAHRSYLLTVRELKNSSEYDFLKCWVE